MKTFPISQNVGKFFTIAFLLFSVCANAQQAEFGAATWVDNNRGEDTNHFYALHKYAPIGTIIHVKNMMNNRITFVKVLGKLCDSKENKGVVIKLSGAAARYLDVLDEKFRVELIIQKKIGEVVEAIQ